MDIYGEMSRSEVMALTVEQKKLRKKYLKKISNKIYQQNNKEKLAEHLKTYRQNNKEKIAENMKTYGKKYRQNNKEKQAEYQKIYQQTDIGKKVKTLSQWKRIGLIASKEDLDRIYNLWLTQELCNACDIPLTRTGKSSSTDSTMDHSHNTGRFRHILCRGCNSNDNWEKYFC